MMLLHDAVQNCIGDGGVTDPCMPVFNGQLAGDDGGLIGSAVIDDFHEVGPRLTIDARHSPIVKQQHVCLGQGDQPLAKRAVAVANA